MADIPARVRADVPVHKSPGLTVWYQPTNTRRDLPRVPGGQRFEAVDALLLSDQIQDALLAAGDDMVDDAVQIAIGKGLVETGDYVRKFERRRGVIVEISDGSYANPRVSVDVGNTSIHSVAIEYGNAQVGAGHSVLGEVAARYDNPKGGD